MGTAAWKCCLPLPRLIHFPSAPQVSDDALHHIVTGGGAPDPLEPEAQVERVRRAHGGAFLDSQAGATDPVVAVRLLDPLVVNWCARDLPTVHGIRVVFERRAALARRDLDVVDEDTRELLEAPVAESGDRDLDLLARVRRQVDLPLLPAARASVRGVPRARRPGARACA